MTWVDRYVAAVERSLPAAGREDVGEEIRSLLQEKLDELRKGLHSERERRSKAEASLLEKIEAATRKLEKQLVGKLRDYLRENVVDFEYYAPSEE